MKGLSVRPFNPSFNWFDRVLRRNSRLCRREKSNPSPEIRNFPTLFRPARRGRCQGGFGANRAHLCAKYPALSGEHVFFSPRDATPETRKILPFARNFGGVARVGRRAKGENGVFWAAGAPSPHVPCGEGAPDRFPASLFPCRLREKNDAKTFSKKCFRAFKNRKTGVANAGFSGGVPPCSGSLLCPVRSRRHTEKAPARRALFCSPFIPAGGRSPPGRRWQGRTPPRGHGTPEG